MSASSLCDRCRGITGEALVSEAGYAHLARRKSCGRREDDFHCKLCKLLRKSEDVSEDSEYLEHEFQLTIQRRGVNLMNLCKNWTADQLGPYRQDPYRRGPASEGILGWYIFTPINDAAAQHGIPTINRYLTNTRSAETFAFIKSCISQCDSKHDCKSAFRMDTCSSYESEITLASWSLRPARLIYLEDASESCVRLVSMSDRKCPAYMTLSHCWGLNLPKECLTLESNIEQRLRSIRVDALPPTFRDAIEIARRLGVLFLWIDTLCIIQDSKEDWAAESVKMGNIYQNSVLTIAASQSKDSFGGCFNQQSLSQDLAALSSPEGRSAIEITGHDSKGIKTNLVLLERDRRSDIFEKSPLGTRGWIFQENSLSPRTVHFTSSQVIWECRSGYQFEDRIPWQPYPFSKYTLSSILQPKLINYKTIELRMGEPRDVFIINHWYHKIVAENYSGRVFTKQSDRLVALAGIASVFQQLARDKYLAGIWESSLVIGLLWHKDKSAPSRRHNLNVEPRRPTWSWASHDGPIKFPQDYGGLREVAVVAATSFEVIDTKLEYSPRYIDDFSPVAGGFIAVKGYLFEMICNVHPRQKSSSCRLAEQSEEGIKWSVCRMDDVEAELKHERVIALLVGSRLYKKVCTVGDEFLLLKQYTERESAYFRVGVASIRYRSFRRDGEFFSPKQLLASVTATSDPRIICLY